MLPRFVFLIFIMVFFALYPLRIHKNDFWSINTEINAKGSVVLGWKDGRYTTLYAKNPKTLYPVASITKLVTAIIAARMYDDDEVFYVSKNAVNTLGVAGGLSAGKELSRDEILKALLIESSNDAGVAIAEHMGTKEFIKSMNDYLRINSYEHTEFVNATGLDPKDKSQTPNSLTPLSTALILNRIYEKRPTVKEIMSYSETPVYDNSGNLIKNLTSTNPLMFDEKLSNKIILSKTGTTKMAGENLALITEGARGFDFFTIVILGSDDRVLDAKKILNVIYEIE